MSLSMSVHGGGLCIWVYKASGIADLRATHDCSEPSGSLPIAPLTTVGRRQQEAIPEKGSRAPARLSDLPPGGGSVSVTHGLSTTH